MADKKISEDVLVALMSVPDTAYVPVVDPEETSASDRNKRMLIKDITDEVDRIDAKTTLPARVAYAAAAFTGLSAPFFTTEDLAITYLSALTPAPSTSNPAKLISYLAPASQSTQNRYTLEAAGIFIARINKSDLPESYYAVDAGAANAISVTLTPAPSAWTDLIGKRIAVKIVATNTGATTFAVTGLSGTKALAGGELLIGCIYDFVYDGTNMQMIKNSENVITIEVENDNPWTWEEETPTGSNFGIYYHTASYECIGNTIKIPRKISAIDFTAQGIYGTFIHPNKQYVSLATRDLISFEAVYDAPTETLYCYLKINNVRSTIKWAAENGTEPDDEVHGTLKLYH